MAQLTCQKLCVGYDGKPVLQDLDFEVFAGDYLCIVGENGSGKSTLMKTILGLQMPISGRILTGDGLRKNEIGYLPQQTVVQKDFPASVREIVLSGCQGRCGSRPFYNKEEKQLAAETMDKMQITQLARRCYRTLSGDVCSTLFGSTSILTLSKSEVWLCAGLSVVVVAVFLLYYNKIFAVTFDEDFAKAVGTKADLYNLLLAVIVAVVIVLAMNLVGSLLISALVIFPALSAMRLFQNFRSVTVCSAVLSVSCAALGILVSILAGTPVGSTIVAADILAFLVCSALGRARGGEAG